MKTGHICDNGKVRLYPAKLCSCCNGKHADFPIADKIAPELSRIQEAIDELQQEWYCDLCFKTGTVPMEEHEGVWEVSQRILSDHKRVSPDCEGGPQNVRILVTN